jgi:hypothetical protein
MRLALTMTILNGAAAFGKFCAGASTNKHDVAMGWIAAGGKR